MPRQPGSLPTIIPDSGSVGLVQVSDSSGNLSWQPQSGSGLGGLTPTAVKTSAYTAAAGDFVPCNTTSAGFTVTLPNAPADKTVVGLKMVIQGSTNTVTIACAGSDVFNKTGGGTSGTLTLASQGMLLQYKAAGAIWYVISDDLPLSQLDTRYVNPGQVPALAGANVPRSLAPSGATGVTFDRAMAAGTSAPGNTGGTLYVRAIALPSGIAVNGITFLVDSTVQVTGTHGWYVLLDSGLVVRAVSADQTTTVWGTTSTPVTLSVSGSAYTTTYSGLYYVGFCTVSATNPVFMGGVTTSSIYTNLPPVLMGTSGTGLTTPPSLGATMTAITGNAAFNFLAWTS